MNSFKIDGVLCTLRPSKIEGHDHIKIFSPLIFLYIILDIWSEKSFFHGKETFSKIYRVESFYKSKDKDRPVIADDSKNNMAMEAYSAESYSKIPFYFLRKDIVFISADLNKIKDKLKTYELFK